jgi:DNA-directed RNA polymerase subunit RPC12/RpoP
MSAEKTPKRVKFLCSTCGKIFIRLVWELEEGQTEGECFCCMRQIPMFDVGKKEKDDAGL